ncbi:MAG TPA: TetR/AcrR family transcriptional regulator [Spirochaetota bacterium]|nr:TetR/AcrR family transcriptional regulator [Spirochaetota bacterium]
MVKKDKTTEEKIINAALDEFAELGYAGARVDSIAEKGEINKAMIYYYFKSKEKLYERILTDITTWIYGQIKEAAVGGSECEPIDQFYSIIGRYVDFLRFIDRRYMRIMMREIASGGEFFRKIAVPNLVMPVMTIIEPLFRQAVERGEIKDLNPYMTFLQIVGSIVFFNIIRIPLEGSPVESIIFKENYYEEFKSNMFRILKSGIEVREGEK